MRRISVSLVGAIKGRKCELRRILSREFISDETFVHKQVLHMNVC